MENSFLCVPTLWHKERTTNCFSYIWHTVTERCRYTELNLRISAEVYNAADGKSMPVMLPLQHAMPTHIFVWGGGGGEGEVPIGNSF